MLWHLCSLLRMWTTSSWWRYRSLLKQELPHRLHYSLNAAEPHVRDHHSNGSIGAEEPASGTLHSGRSDADSLRDESNLVSKDAGSP
jgi:hypothetical protein